MKRKITLRVLFMVFGLFLAISLKASYVCDGVVDNIVYQLYDDATARTHGCDKSIISGSLTIPDKITYKGATYTVTGIGRETFRKCTGLTSITIPDNVTFVGQSAFEGCTNLISISIGNGLRDIGGSAFQGCTSLSSFIIPEGIENVSDAFRNCTNLTSVTIPSTVKYISQTSFLGCTSLKAFIVSEENQTYTSLEGILFTKDKTSLRLYPNAKSSEYIVPNSVTNIGNGAFKNCTGLKSITIPCGQIEDSAFLGCSELTSVTLGDKVTKIGFVAFYNCPKLKEIYSLNPTPPVGIYDDDFADFFSDMTKENAILYVLPGSIPAYRATDMWKDFKVILEKGNETSITQCQNSALKVYSLLDRVIIENAVEGEIVSISDLAGKTVYRGIGREISLNSGIYIVKVGSFVQKVMVE